MLVPVPDASHSSQLVYHMDGFTASREFSDTSPHLNPWQREIKRQREEQRKIPQEVKKYYNYALKRPAQAEKPEVLFDNEEILDDKEKIHKKEEQFLAEFMGKNRKRWYLNNGRLHPN